VAQSQETCVVFGMPKAAIERGFVMRVADLQEMPKVLQAQCAHDPGRRDAADVKQATSAGGN